jgi:pimeloyl-ACP methyl ester carboxylesterase
VSLYTPFTPFHRGGSGPPLICLHGFMDAWRTWELVLPALERHHDVLALTMAGHAGGPPLEGEPGSATLADAIERAMDDASIDRAHVVGNSLGGHVALQLAERDRAETVVALAPAGGWAKDDASYVDLLQEQRALHEQSKQAAPHAAAILSTPEGRRRATRLLTSNYQHIPEDLLVHQVLAAAACRDAARMIDLGLRDGWPLDAARITCPVRIVWGTEDRLLPWPRAAERYRTDWLPHADWVVLDGVGHYPQMDTPLETAQLILGFTR